METEDTTQAVAKKNEMRKRATTVKPKQAVTISDDEEEESMNQMPAIEEDIDDDFEIADAPKAKKGAVRKPTAKAGAVRKPAAKPKAAAQGKRQPAAKSQNISPEKKVRRMRASPFNKKSSSLIGRVASSLSASGGSGGDSGGSSSSNEARNRPKRETRPKVKYVVSDDSEVEVPVTDDSDFDADD